MAHNLDEVALDAALAGGRAAMNHYRSGIGSEVKGDGSPVTQADRDSHNVICDILAKTNIPVISEEGKIATERSRRYWLVDPLDGTKDFIAENDEFTVNIALIEGDYPVLGIIFAPALNEIYCAGLGVRPWVRISGMQSPIQAHAGPQELSIFSSRFHESEKSVEFSVRYGVAQVVPMGSALKYARLAVGQVNVYPRFVGTSEWDTAAGQVILESCGGGIVDYTTGQRMSYGKKNWRNNSFLAYAPGFSHERFLQELV